MNKTISILFLSIALVGCLATTDLKSDASISPEDRALAQKIAELAERTCITYEYEQSSGRKTSGDMKMHTQPAVKRLYRSQSGWVKAELQINNVWDNGYYNQSRNIFRCGEKEWEALGLSSQVSFFEIGRGFAATPPVNQSSPSARPVADEQLPRAALPIPAASQQRTQSNAMKDNRPIAMRWEGFASLISGIVELEQNGKKGSVKAALPRGEGQCSGTFEMSNQTNGVWAVSCTNGLTASGTLEAFGSGRGSAGAGIDTKGNRVDFTIGAAQ